MKQWYRSVAVLVMVLFVSLVLYSCGGGGGSSSSSPSITNPVVSNPSGNSGTTSNSSSSSNNSSSSSSSSSSTSDNTSSASGSSSSSQTLNYWRNGEKVNLSDVSVNNGYGTCTEDSFSWSGTLVLTQMSGAKYTKILVNNGDAYLYFDPFNNITYAVVYDEQDNGTSTTEAYTVNLDNSQPVVENGWLKDLITGLNVSNSYIVMRFATYIKNHIILMNPSDTSITIYDIDTVNHTLNETSFSGYNLYAQFNWNLAGLGKDNGSEIALIPAQNAGGNRTFIYVNPNQVMIDNTDIDTGYTPPTNQTDDYYYTCYPVEANGKVYITEFNSTDSSSILHVEDAVSGQPIETYTIKDIFNTTTNLSYNYFRFNQPVVSQNGKYAFTLASLYLPSSDNSSTGYEFDFMVKINTETNSIEGIYPVYRIKDWYVGDYTVSPDGKYVYMVISEEGPNFTELLVINTENGKESAYKFYVDPNITGDLGPYNQIITWTMPSKMMPILNGTYLYLPLIMYNTPYYYIAEIPTAQLNSSVQ